MKERLNVAIGERIRRTRELMSLSRESFSELCDISDSFLSDVERGNKSITTKTLHKICTASHVSADYIVFGTDKNNTNITVIAEMLRNLDNRYLPYAINILSEYIQAVHLQENAERKA